MQFIRIILGLGLLIIGALLGDGYKNSLYLYWLLTSAFLMIYSEFVTSKLLSTTDQLHQYKDKVSTLTMLKGNGANVIQMSIMPNNEIVANHEVKIDLFITSAIPIITMPDIKLSTDTQWNVKVSSQSQSSRHFAGKYEYILINPIHKNIDKKYIQISFYITVDSVGQHDLFIELNNGSIKGKLHNKLTVYS